LTSPNVPGHFIQFILDLPLMKILCEDIPGYGIAAFRIHCHSILLLSLSGAMSDNLARLKNLGMAMTTEIETQNEQIDRINLEVDRADTNVYGQTKQMSKILHG
jgi:hypothetical protein